MAYLGATIRVSFATYNIATGAQQDSATLPVGTLIRNGADTAETVTVTKVAATTGRYYATFTIPAGWTLGDSVELNIQAQTDQTQGAILWFALIESQQTGDSFARIGATGSGLTTITAKLDTIDDLLDTEIAAIKLQTDKISTSAVNVIDPTGGGDHIRIKRGDTFPSSEADPGTALTFTKADGEDWPDDLSASWTITLTARVNTDNLKGGTTAGATITLTKTATVVTATGASQAIKFNDFTLADMTGLSVGNHVYDWDIEARNGTKRVTLRSGTMTVDPDYTTG